MNKSKTKIIKDNITPNMVLVKKNNFYFFEKGTKMKTKTKQNLFDQCFSKTFEKDSASYQKTNSDKIHTQNNNINTIESILSNSFTLNQCQSPKSKIKDFLKLKVNHQDSNKIFEDPNKIKQKIQIKAHLTYQNNQIVLFLIFFV